MPKDNAHQNMWEKLKAVIQYGKAQSFEVSELKGMMDSIEIDHLTVKDIGTKAKK